jgi:hypothetical protein
VDTAAEKGKKLETGSNSWELKNRTSSWEVTFHRTYSLQLLQIFCLNVVDTRLELKHSMERFMRFLVKNN